MSLYQKYRPKDFHSLHGQLFVREALSSALAQDRTVGAYLFYGSRGTGKTSVARILAKAVNCLALKEDGNPCGECEHCKAFEESRMLDVIEIDAASHTGVDNIREVIERAQFRPNSGRYKVYIIDEAHMLSKGAFNALLKTLEEPPEHVKFVLATTEIHRVPETIVSRTQRYDFRKISLEDISSRLRFVAESEGIEAEEDAILLIAKLARGGMRDALTLFEQYSAGGRIERAYIESRLGLVRDEDLEKLFASIISGESKGLFAFSDSLFERVTEVRVFLEQFLAFLRDLMVEKVASPDFAKYSLVFDTLFDIYPKLRQTPDQKVILDAAFAKLVSLFSNGGRMPEMGLSEKTTPATPMSKPTKSSTLEESIDRSPKVSPGEKEIVKEVPKIDDEAKAEEAPVLPSSPPPSKRPFSIMELVTKITSTPGKAFVGVILKNAAFSCVDNVLTIRCASEFDRKKFDNADVRALIVETANELFDGEFIVTISKETSPKAAKSLKSEDITDVF